MHRDSAAPTAGEAAPTSGDAQLRSAGRGGLALTAAKLYFLVLGLAQQVALSWLLKDAYGALRGALSPASITYNPLVAAGVQGMSRAVSRAGHGATAHSLRSALLVHFVIAAVTGLGFFLAAPLLGEWLNSHYLVPAFRWLSLAIFGYGIYAPLVGVLNGQRRFLLQAGLDTLAATTRTVALCVGGWLFLNRGTSFAVSGASLGFSLVTLLMFLISAALVRPAFKGDARPKAWEHLAFVGPVIFAQWLLNLLLQADTNTLRAFATRAAERAGLVAQDADALVAAYNAAQLFGFLPYQLLMGITFIVFPLLARAHAEQNKDGVLHYTRTGLRIALIVTGALVSVTSGLAPSLMRVVFPPSFAEIGAPSMGLLCIGLGGFALFGMTTTVLNSLGRQWRSLGITAVSLALVVGLNFVLVRPLAFGNELLRATATATSIGIGIGLILSLVEVRRAAGGIVPAITAGRALMATASCVLVGRLLPDLSRVMTVLASAAVIALYIGILVATREVGRSELESIRVILRRRR